VALLAVAASAGLVAAGLPPAAPHTASVTTVPHLKLSPSSGPPTSTVRVSGSGFGAYRAVDIYFGITDKALAATNGHGAFSGIPVKIPASAMPGTHYITAVQRHSGKSAQARFLVNTNWAQFRYSIMHTGFNPYENVLSATTVSGLDEHWSFLTDGFPGLLSSPAVANDVVYINSNIGTIYALKASTGAKLWSFNPGGPVNDLDSSPAVANGAVYISSANGNLYALNGTTGAKLWEFTTGSHIYSTPAVANGVVYIGSSHGTVYALNGTTGAKLWKFTTGSNVDSTPAVANGVVYVGNDDGNVYALNASTGAELWSFFAFQYPIESSPAVANGVVYVLSADDTLYALSPSSGQELWSFNINPGASPGPDALSSPAVANGVVYIGSPDDNVYALNASTGAELWNFTTGFSIESSPAVANGVVYIGSFDGNVYALNASTGADLWSFTTEGGVYSSPAVANGMVYVGSEDGNVYAFGLPREVATKRPVPAQLHPNYALRP
jgi:outer membrane protein assembly factor BamB